MSNTYQKRPITQEYLPNSNMSLSSDLPSENVTVTKKYKTEKGATVKPSDDFENSYQSFHESDGDTFMKNQEIDENKKNDIETTNGNISNGERETNSTTQDEEEEPDWDEIVQHEPAKTDVPMFVAARDRRNAADERFAVALDECHANLKQSIDALLSVAAGTHNAQSEKLDTLEIELKQDFIFNDDARKNMQKKLEESASLAQGLFKQLLMRLSQTKT